MGMLSNYLNKGDGNSKSEGLVARILEKRKKRESLKDAGKVAEKTSPKYSE